MPYLDPDFVIPKKLPFQPFGLLGTCIDEKYREGLEPRYHTGK